MIEEIELAMICQTVTYVTVILAVAYIGGKFMDILKAAASARGDS